MAATKFLIGVIQISEIKFILDYWFPAAAGARPPAPDGTVRPAAARTRQPASRPRLGLLQDFKFKFRGLNFGG